MWNNSRRPPVWLAALTLAAFAVQTDDFIIIGVLPAIASDLDVSEAAAGQLVTIYSLVYALTAPLWAFLLSRVPLRTALLGSLAVFSAANFAVPLAGSFPALVALRVIAALAAAVVLPCALAAASTGAPSGRRGRYLATVMTGLTGAILVGVPAGTWIGATLDWRATFVFGGLLGVAALVLVRALPGAVSDAQDEERSIGTLLRPMLNRAVAAILLITVLTVAGNLAFQTYISVVLAGLAGVTPGLLAVLLVCSGIGGLLGTRASGRLVDRFGAVPAFLAAGMLFCAAMSAFALLWLARPVPVPFATVLLVLWSAAAWAVPPTLQALMLDRVGARTAAQAMAVHSSSVYVGAALGGTVGGAVTASGVGLVPLAAALSMALGLALSPLARSTTTAREPSGDG
ncbi:putative MFS family arabinose efflux permease [Lipingzhangella halophila]|uniref:Putative MFS family arabinose efflux permease n=1 Tax=Lipingzhangella halophila TaxID=1783352 RepID=A0A7W7W6I6_9ACTN|nr:MFS transporter [Lipingzhangella halophila]MBB4934890.1 putative MFS family arabinose efflux permease [Lipingzhangella halophila]